MLNKMKIKEEDLPITSCEVLGSLDRRIVLSSNLDSMYDLKQAKDMYKKDNCYPCIYFSLDGTSTGLTLSQLEEFVTAGQSMIKYIKGE